jgi:hypothetical protein
MFPTRFTQAIQVIVQNRIITPVLASRTQLTPPWPARLLNRLPFLQQLIARVVAVGVRPEHVQTPEKNPSS